MSNFKNNSVKSDGDLKIDLNVKVDFTSEKKNTSALLNILQ